MLRTSTRVALAGSLAALALSGCYVVPVNSEGVPIYPYPAGIATAPPAVVYAAPTAAPGAPMPSVLQARLYPSNEAASRMGMLTGTVTNMMTGKGRFQLDVAGEILSGEATRASGDERAGVAAAYGPRGTYMTCEYRMTTPYVGTGTCHLSTGALYQVHLGV